VPAACSPPPSLLPLPSEFDFHLDRPCSDEFAPAARNTYYAREPLTPLPWRPPPPRQKKKEREREREKERKASSSSRLVLHAPRPSSGVSRVQRERVVTGFPPGFRLPSAYFIKNCVGDPTTPKSVYKSFLQH
jgi:hypothetical protein